jgi:O-antigen/teichoic acid export membrane protein
VLQRLSTDTFLRKYVIYFSGSIAVAFLNYLFYPMLGRLLPPAQFGDIQALVSMMAQTGIIFGALSVVVVNITANTESEGERNAIIAELRKISLYIMGASALLLLLISGKIESFLNFSSIYPVIALAVLLVLSALSTFRSAFLQGKGRFGELSVNGVISAGGRLGFAVLFITLGFATLGATLGIVLSQIVALYYLVFRTRGALDVHSTADIHVLEAGRVRGELLYGLLVLCATGLVTFLYTSDILIVKHYFDADTAGVYSGVSSIAKILFFLLGPTAGVLLSAVKIKNSKRENDIVLFKSLAISALIGGAGLCTFYVFHDMIIKLMIGAKYLSLAHVLPKAGLVMLLSAIINIFVYYFLALRQKSLIAVSIIGALSLVVCFAITHETIDAVLNNLIITISILITLLVALYAKDHFTRRTGI